MDMIQHSQWRKHLKLHLPVGQCLQKKPNNIEREWKIIIIKKKMHITQEMLLLDHIIKWVNWQKGGVAVGVAYSKKCITSKQFR